MKIPYIFLQATGGVGLTTLSCILGRHLCKQDDSARLISYVPGINMDLLMGNDISPRFFDDLLAGMKNHLDPEDLDATCLIEAEFSDLESIEVIVRAREQRLGILDGHTLQVFILARPTIYGLDCAYACAQDCQELSFDPYIIVGACEKCLLSAHAMMAAVRYPIISQVPWIEPALLESGQFNPELSPWAQYAEHLCTRLERRVGTIEHEPSPDISHEAHAVR